MWWIPSSTYNTSIQMEMWVMAPSMCRCLSAVKDKQQSRIYIISENFLLILLHSALVRKYLAAMWRQRLFQRVSVWCVWVYFSPLFDVTSVIMHHRIHLYLFSEFNNISEFSQFCFLKRTLLTLLPLNSDIHCTWLPAPSCWVRTTVCASVSHIDALELCLMF